MKSLLIMLALAILPFGLLSAAEFTEKDLKVEIGKMVKLIEDKKYEDLINAYVTPDEIAAMVKKGKTVKELAEEFGKGEKPEQLKTALAAIGNQTATTDAEKKTMTFEVELGKAKRPMTFVFIETKWYLAGH